MTKPTCFGIASRVFLALMLGGMAISPPSVSAGPGSCMAGADLVMSGYAEQRNFFTTEHTGCTAGVPSGAANGCFRITVAATTNMNVFRADWLNEAARLADSTGGCVFMCTTGSCRVGNDALPVELLSFGIE